MNPINLLPKDCNLRGPLLNHVQGKMTRFFSHFSCNIDEFFDQGEHYYGIWEYPFGGNIDNRGADHDSLGLANSRYVHHSSVRAPFYATSHKYGLYVESVQ
jgi:hypothetical protein